MYSGMETSAWPQLPGKLAGDCPLSGSNFELMPNVSEVVTGRGEPQPFFAMFLPIYVAARERLGYYRC
jgi:hypothetical protein